MNELHLFAGCGGGILGGMLLGHTTVCAIEIEPYCRKALLQRQRDGMLPRFPIWDDVRTFDGNPWRGKADVVCGGFPCKGISVAGSGTGLDHEESGLWTEQARIIGEVRPDFVFVENSPALTTRGGLRVIGELTKMGYDCRGGVMGAADAIWSYGAPCLDHERLRIWIVGSRRNTNVGRCIEPGAVKDFYNHIDWSRPACEREWHPESGKVESASKAVAYAHRGRELQSQRSEQNERGWFGNGGCSNAAESPNTNDSGCQEQRQPIATEAGRVKCDSWWATEPGVGRMVNGLAHRVDRIRAIGNGQVPAVVKLAWRTLFGQAR